MKFLSRGSAFASQPYDHTARRVEIPALAKNAQFEDTTGNFVIILQLHSTAAPGLWRPGWAKCDLKSQGGVVRRCFIPQPRSP